jgi:hypothetical protein
MTGHTSEALPSSIAPATTGTGTGHAGYLTTGRTMCDRDVRGWPSGGREAITCRTCVSKLARYRWSTGDHWPAVSLAELADGGFLLP